jgi:O-antigen/teichoic acid export membrane protein
MAPESRGAHGAPASDVDTGEPPENLTSVVLTGVAWKAGTRVVSGATRAGVIVVLARLLTPEDYGIAGMALLVTSLGLLFTDPALGAALIQRPTIDERDRSTVFWLAAAIGLVLTLLGIALSGVVADFFGEDEVRNLVVVSSLCLFVTSLSVAQRALLVRRLAYRSLEIREMVSLLAGAAAAIAVAVAGFGPWAIIANFVVYTLVGTILVWVLLDWRPRAVFSTASVRNLGGFSARIFAATILTWGNQNLATALVGRVLGAAALGAYSLAYNAMLLPMTLLGRPMFQALSPAYSRIQHDSARLERVWLRSKRISSAVLAPALLALIIVAPDFVPVVFGEQWDEAVVPLQLLCVGGLANTLVTMQWSLLQARGEAGVLLRVTLLSSLVTWAAFVAGLPWGIVGVAAFYAGAKWLLVVPTTWLTTRGVSFSFPAALRAGMEMLPAAVATAAVGVVARELLTVVEVAAFLRLLLVSAAMLASYVATIFVLSPTLVRDVREVIARRADDGGLSSQPA